MMACATGEGIHFVVLVIKKNFRHTRAIHFYGCGFWLFAIGTRYFRQFLDGRQFQIHMTSLTITGTTFFAFTLPLEVAINTVSMRYATVRTSGFFIILTMTVAAGDGASR